MTFLIIESYVLYMKKAIILLVILLVGCTQDKAISQVKIMYDYNIWFTSKIAWKDILTQPEPNYLVYVYSPNCGYCDQVKQVALEYYQTTMSKMYVVFNDETITYTRTENIEKMVGIEDIEQLAIIGVPTLIFITSAKVEKVLSGAKNITEFFIGNNDDV